MEKITEGDGGGGKGRFWGGGNRQSHRGSALSLIGCGLSRPQGKGVPSDSTTCRPSNNSSPPSRPLGSLQAPGFSPPSLLPSTYSSRLLPPTHIAPASCTLLCTPACLSSPWATICTNLPSRCLAHSAFASGSRGPLSAQTPYFPSTHCISSSTFHTLPVSNSCLRTLPLVPSFTHLTPENL